MTGFSHDMMCFSHDVMCLSHDVMCLSLDVMCFTPDVMCFSHDVVDLCRYVICVFVSMWLTVMIMWFTFILCGLLLLLYDVMLSLCGVIKSLYITFQKTIEGIKIRSFNWCVMFGSFFSRTRPILNIVLLPSVWPPPPFTLSYSPIATYPYWEIMYTLFMIWIPSENIFFKYSTAKVVSLSPPLSTK